VLDIPFSLILIGVLVAFGLARNKISRWEGGLLVGFYTLYLILMGVFFM